MDNLSYLISIITSGNSEKIIEYVQQSKVDDLTVVIEQLQELVNEQTQKLDNHTPFSYITSPEVSGAGGCSARTCRLNRTESFAIYSALYADTVYVNIDCLNDPHFFSLLRNNEYNFRYQVTNDLLMLNLLAPLIKQDIVRIVKPKYKFCDECIKELLGPSVLDIDINELEDHYIELSPVFVEYDREYKTYSTRFENVGDLFDHETLILHSNKFEKKLAKRAKESPNGILRLSKDEVKEYGLLKKVLEDEIERIRLHVLESRLLNTKFLTSRSFDSYLLEMSSKTNTKKNSFVDVKQRVPLYDLPILSGISIDKILQIRDQEGEAFQNYRLALTKAAKERIKENSYKELNELYEDIIYPSFIELETKLTKMKKGTYKKVLGDFIVIGSIVGLGISSGLIPSDPKSIVTALGGVAALTEAGSSLVDWARKKDDVKENDFYFLWKLKES